MDDVVSSVVNAALGYATEPRSLCAVTLLGSGINVEEIRNAFAERGAPDVQVEVFFSERPIQILKVELRQN